MSRNMSDSVQYEWAATRFTGTQAKFVSAQAGAGIGYYVLDRPEKGDAWIIAAYRRPLGPHEPHIQLVDDERMIEKLEKWAKPLQYKVEDRRKEIEAEERKRLEA